MEWLAQCIDRIIQSQIWRFVATHFYWVDWATLFFLFWGLVYGLRTGFLRTLVRVGEAFLVAYVTFLYHDKASVLLHTYLPFLSRKALPGMGFVVLALPLTLLVHVIDTQICQWFKTTLAPPVRMIGGAIAGIFYGIFLWSFLSQPLVATPIKALQKSYEPGISISGAFVKNLAPDIYKKVKR